MLGHVGRFGRNFSGATWKSCWSVASAPERPLGLWRFVEAILTAPLEITPVLAKGESFRERLAPEPEKGRYLVDPASSHMLVSKIKPCMSKYKLFYTVKLRMAH